MKKSNKLISILLIVAMLFVQMPLVKAAGGSARVTLTASTTNPTVGSTVTITVGLSDITGATNGVMGFQGTLVYDDSEDSVLEMDESKQQAVALSAAYADSAKTIAGLSFNPATNIKATSSGIIKLTFNIVKKGTTTIKVINPEITAGDNAILSSGEASITLTADEPTPKSTNANLKSLSITSGSTTYPFNETFNKDTLTYNVTVPHTVSSVTINAAAEDSKAKSVSNTGAKTLKAAGQTSSYTVMVTAEDGTTKKSYVVNIHREATPYVPSTDNKLKDLSVSGYTLSPAFDPTKTNYEVTVPFDADEVNILADKNDSKATVSINGNTGLKVGDNEVTVTVTAEDGSVKNYTINVKKQEKLAEPVVLDNDATLKSLNPDGFSLTPTFTPGNSVYSINVGEKVTGLNITAIPNSDKAKVEIKGASGWQYGMNTVTVVVTAEDGSQNTYILNVNRKSPTTTTTKPLSQDNYLSELSVQGTTMNPVFDKNLSNYTVVVPYETNDIKLDFKKSDSKSKVEIIGGNSLLVGEVNTVQVKVTAEDGSVRIYTLNVTRSAQKSQTSLKELSAGEYDLSPFFDKDVLKYNVTVKNKTKSLDLTAIPEFENSSVEILGNKDFKVGNNTVLIKVTDENGFNKIYQIDVERESWSFMGMSMMNYVFFFIILGLIALLLLLIALLKRKKGNPAPVIVDQQAAPTPIIEFKPEFNFGSKNGTDDDVVYQGTLNQGNALDSKEATKKLIEDAKYREAEDANFDYFDETITKDEIISAIKEGMETKNPDKLKMLLKQDELNQLKKEIKEKEEQKRSDRYE